MLRNIEAERVRRGMSKEDLAHRLGTSLKTYYNWVNEATDIPGIALIKMSRIFDTDVEYLMEGCEGVNPMDFTDKPEKEVI